MSFPMPGEINATIHPRVLIGPAVPKPLLPTTAGKIVRVVVDTHLHMPDMFEITFADDDGIVALEAGLAIGAAVMITSGSASSAVAEPLIIGEITAIETRCEGEEALTIARGYDRSHRLQRAKHTRTFVNETDDSIARKIALSARLVPGEIHPCPVPHEHISQVNQTDWEFLQERAREIGFEVGVADDTFYFRDPALAAVTATAKGPAILRFKTNLLSFSAGVNAAKLTPSVEVRVWDPVLAQTFVGHAPTVNSSAQTIPTPGAPAVPAAMAAMSTGMSLPIPPPLRTTPPPPAALSVPPDPNAHVVVSNPVGTGPLAMAAAQQMAMGEAERVGSAATEAEGYALGDPKIRAGRRIEVIGVPMQFVGTWTVSQARHIFDEKRSGYRTQFWVSGRDSRSLLGLTGGAQESPTRIDGFVCGIVTNNTDPGPPPMGRVKVALPWLSPEFESSWARVVQPGGGQGGGALFVPEVGDEVLVGFEFGDIRRPYVVGGLINGTTTYHLMGLGGPAVMPPGAVVRRGIVSPAGNRLVFNDKMPPGGEGPALESSILLGSMTGATALEIDPTMGSISLDCMPIPPESNSPAGRISITCGPGGDITISAGEGGRMTIDGGAMLDIKAAKISIAADAALELKANAQLKASAPMIDLG